MQSFRVVESVSKHTGTVIFLHGLGDNGASFVPFAKGLQKTHPHLKWVLPTAKSIPITTNGGMRMPGWFDIPDFGRLTNPVHDDQTGMLLSVTDIESLIKTEVDNGIPENRIIVGGFSQGCVIGVLTGLTTKRKLGGVIGLSGWVPLSHKIESMISPTASSLPIFWGHGKLDQVVPYQFGLASSKLLQTLPNLKMPLLDKGEVFRRPGLRFEGYEGVEHSMGYDEVQHVSDWLGQAVPNS